MSGIKINKKIKQISLCCNANTIFSLKQLIRYNDNEFNEFVFVNNDIEPE